MSLLDKLHALIDPALEATFNRKAYDPSKDRAWLVKRLEAAKSQFGATETTRGGGAKWWRLSNGVVSFSPLRADRQPIVINGKATNFIPGERFEGFLDAMIDAVNAGEFDSSLKGDTPAGSSVAMGSLTATRKSKPVVEGGSVRRWSDEQKAKFKATVAERKAAKLRGGVNQEVRGDGEVNSAAQS